jgi:hypothetical protein
MTVTHELRPPDAFLKLEAKFETTKDAAVKANLDAIGREGVKVAASLAPKTGAGKFVKGLTYKVDGHGPERTVTVTSTAEDAGAVESGRRPGKMPPYQVIQQTYNIEPSQAFVVARMIGERGTKGLHVFEQTTERIQPAVAVAGREITTEVARAL